MRKLLAIFVITALASAVLAAPAMIQFTSVSGETNAAATATATTDTDMQVEGWVDTIIVDLGGYATSPTGTLVIATTAGKGTGAARTILTKAVTADASFPVRDIVSTTAGADISNVPARIPLVGDHLTAQFYACNSGTNTAITATVYVILSPIP